MVAGYAQLASIALDRGAYHVAANLYEQACAVNDDRTPFGVMQRDMHARAAAACRRQGGAS